MDRAPLTPGEEWLRCRPWIEAANAHGLGTHTIDDILEEIVEGEAHFWPGKACAVVTCFQITPRIKGLHFWLCGGDLTELVEDMRPKIEAWGAAQGCTRFTTAGRKGWLRVMEKYGYAPAWHSSAKDIGDGH